MALTRKGTSKARNIAVALLVGLTIFGNAQLALAEFNAKFFVTQNNVSQPTIRADEHSGALTYSVPIVVPPGRNGLQPDIALVYNNQRNNNDNIVGYGWDIPIPYIERVNKTGTQNLYKDSESNFSSSFDGELSIVATTSALSDFAPRFATTESKDYVFDQTNKVWRVYDTEGTLYVFGSTTASRMNNPNASAQIHRWMLNEVRDSNDNYVAYTYTKDGGQIYPSVITYTGHGSTDGDFEITFSTEARNDKVPTYTPAFGVTTRYRINQILVEISGSWVRKYDLAYTTGANGSRSLLSSVTETGKDKDGNETALPAVTFSYQSGNPGWSIDATWDSPKNFLESVSGGDNSVRFADINGDGLIDLTQAYGSAGQGACDTKYIGINDGSGWNSGGGSTLPECFRIAAAGLDDTATRIGDFNGDGYTEVVRARDENGSTTEKFYLNARNRSDFTFESHSEWDIPQYFYHWSSGYLPTRLMDANTDGQADVVGSGGLVYLFNATTTGWSASSSVYGTTGQAGDDPVGEQFADFNGDGLVDQMVSAYQPSIENRKSLHLNTGTGFAEAATSSIPLYFYEDISFNDRGVRIADINNDGLPDFIQEHETSSSQTLRKVFVSSSTSTTPNWMYSSTLSSAIPPIYFSHYDTAYRDSGWRVLDVNGDGLDDFIGTYYYDDPTGPIRVETYINTGNRADILSQVTTAQGGTVSFTYKSTLGYKDGTGKVMNTEMPSPIITVNTITHNDGFGTPWTETTDYVGASYYFNGAADRRFAGFHNVTKTDGAGNRTVTYFHTGTSTDSTLGEYQDHIAKAFKPYRIEAYNSSGALFSKTIHKWERYEVGNGRDFVKLTQTLNFSYDGDSDHKESAESFFYDNGTRLLSQHVKWGEVSGSDTGIFTDSGTDKRFTDFTYASSTGITGIIAEEITKNNASTTVRDIKHYYDGLSLWNVTKGNETKSEAWETGSTYIDTEKTFNTYGLVTQEKDPRDKATTYVYEAKNIHVATTTNPDGHVTERYLDYSSGKVQKFVDPNGRAFETTYDGLDRVTSEKIPDAASPATLVNKKTIAYTDTVGSRKTLETNYLGSATTTELYTYLDGFDRKVQTRKEAEDTNTYAVRDFEYNLVELLKRESLPYFGIGSSRAASTSDSTFYTTYTYDALRRLTNELNAVGSTTRAYDDWTTTVIDPLNNTKQFTADAFGNLTTVIEHDDGSQYTSTYEYNARNDLTKITDSLANVRNFTYDGLSRLTKAEDLHDTADTGFASTTNLYDAAGNITTKIDGKNQTVTFTYDDINRVLTEDYTGSAGTEVSFAYDTCPEGVGRLCSATTTPAAANFVYDALGNIISEEKTIGSTRYLTSFTYDRQGNMTNVAYPVSGTLAYRFNAAGLLETVEALPTSTSTLSSLIVTNTNYGPTEQVTGRVFGNGDVSLYDYNEHALYRLSNIATLVGTTTSFNGRNPVATAGATNVHQDGAELVGNLIDLMGTTTVTVGFRYGLLLDDDDPWTATTTTMTATSTGPFSISLLGLEDFKDYSFQSFMSTSSTAVYYGDRYRFYTADLTMSMPVYKEHQRAWTLKTYNADGTHTNTTVGGPSLATTTPAKYLKLVNQGSTTTPSYVSGYWLSDPWDLSPITNVEGSFIEYCVCARNGSNVTVKAAITTSTSTTPSASDFTIATSTTAIPGISAGSNLYGKYLWLKIELEPNGAATTTPCLCRINLGINNVGTTTSAHNALQSLTYTYDAVGNITQVKDLSGFGGYKTVNYTYDDLYRLLTASTTVPANGGYNQTFTYDRVGNILTSPQGTYTYGETGYTNPHGVTAIGGNSLTYDNNGNVTAFGSDTHTWNYRDRLTKSIVGGVNTFYGYDFNNDRVTKGNGTATTTYSNRYYEATTATTTRYVWAGDTLLATIEGTGTATSTKFAHQDHLNSTTITTDEDGDVITAKDYLPFGSERVSTGGPIGRTYIGEYGDTETSLSYLNARYYEGSRGQFLSQDPAFWRIPRAAVLADPQLMNSYSYARNNPIILKDADGEMPTAAAGALIGGGIGLGVQFAADAMSGNWSSWQSYAGAAAGGAVQGAFWGSGAGVVVLLGSGIAGGVAQGGVRESLNGLSGNGFNAGAIGQDVGVSAVSNLLGGGLLKAFGAPAIAGITTGRNSFDAITQSIFTKLQNGTISNVSLGTQAKMGVSYAINNAYSSGIQTLIQARQQAAQSYNASLGGGGSSPNPGSLWVTPSGAVVTWSGSLVTGPAAQSTPMTK